MTDWRGGPPHSRPQPERSSARTWALALACVAVLVGFVGPEWLRSPRQWFDDRDDRAAFGVDPSAARQVEVPPLEHPAPEGVEASPYPPGFDPEPGAALQGDLDWWWSEDFMAGQGFVGDPVSGWRPANPYRSTDFASRYVTVVDGNRRTWSPPPCDCDRLSVWMYGGSTTFGLNQRDEHTIASELARVAHENGVWLDVSNRGKNGHLHWIEAELFALDLTVDEAPDLVVFYDGWNDRWASGSRRWLVQGVAAPVDPSLIDLWAGTGRADPPVPDGPPGSRLLPEVVPDLGLDAHARAVHEQYDRTRRLSTRTARLHGVLPRYFWQPSRYSRDLVLEEPHFDTATENGLRAEDQTMSRHVADDVVDLTDALDDNDEPLFTDDVHHNEKGARLIAEAIFASLRADLEMLASEGER